MVGGFWIRQPDGFKILRQLVFWVAVGFLVGVVVLPFINLPANVVVFLFLLATVLFIVARWRPQSYTLYLVVASLVLGLALGLGRMYVTLAEENILAKQVGESVSLQGVIIENPDKRDTTTRLMVEELTTGERILVSTTLYQDLYYGDLLQVSGKLNWPENFTTDSGREFDYVSYLKVRDVVYEISFAKVERLSGGHGKALYAGLYSLKQKFVDRLNLVLPEPHSSLLAGLLVGERRGLGDDLTESFRRAGLIHVVVLSGYNMTIVAEAIILVLASFLPLTYSLFLGALGIILFALMVGGGATVVRASIMAGLALFARLTGRTYEAANGLFIAAVIMVAINPLVLVYDVGFQLSFIATLGLIYISPILDNKINWLSPRFGLKAVVTTTLAAQIAVLPWLIYKIGEISLVSLPANILVAPLIPVTMFFGFITGLTGFISYFLSKFLAVFTYLFLSLELLIVKFWSALPLASVYIPRVSFWLIILVYLIMVYWVRVKYFSLISTVEAKNMLKEK